MVAPVRRPARRSITNAASVPTANDDGIASGGGRSPAEGGLTVATSIAWLLTFLGFLVGSRVIGDNSFFTHFATGKQILTRGAVPITDPYSFTAAGEPWTVQSWLPSLIYRGLYETLGMWSVRLFNGALAAAIAMGLWQLATPARTLLIRVGLVGAGVTVGAMMWSPRPLLVGLLCLTIVLGVVERQWSPVWLVPTMWVWVNSHGSFPLAFALLGAVVVGEAFDSRSMPKRELTIVGWAMGGLAVAAVNPLGPKLLIFPFQLLGRNEALKDVSEWAPPSFKNPAEWVFLLLLFALIVAAKNGAGWRHLLPALGFFFTGLLAVRNINPAAIVMIAMAAPALGAIRGSLEGKERGFVPKAIGTVVVACAIVVVGFTAVTPALDLDRFPVEEVDWLEDRGLVANPEVNVIHRDIVGNYLELRFGENANVFFDDRYDFYPLDLVDDHATLFFGGDFETILERYEADVVLWASSGEFAEWLLDGGNGWDVTVEGENWLVAVRS